MQSEPGAEQAQRPRDRHEARRQALRRAAVILATERGYAGITLTMVAARAGLSRAQAAALYALVGDLIADAVRAHLAFLTTVITDLAVHCGVGQLPPGQGPRTLEQVALALLYVMSERRHVQQVSLSGCGLTPTQAEAVSRQRQALHLSLAAVLTVCLPGLSAQDAPTLAARAFALLELEARGSDHSDPSRRRAAAAVTAAVIAMAGVPAVPATQAAEGDIATASVAPAPPAQGAFQTAAAIRYQPDPGLPPPPAFTLPPSFAAALVPQRLDTG